MIPWPVPTDVYLDTSVIVAAIFPEMPGSAASDAFCNDLIAANSTVYISHATWADFARALRRLATKPNRLPSRLHAEYALDQWGRHPLVRRRWLAHGARELDDLLDRFARTAEIAFSDPIWRRGLEIMAAEALDASDALHLAAARVAGVPDFATLDSDFRRIDSPRIHVIRDPHERAR